MILYYKTTKNSKNYNYNNNKNNKFLRNNSKIYNIKIWLNQVKYNNLINQKIILVKIWLLPFKKKMIQIMILFYNNINYNNNN